MGAIAVADGVGGCVAANGLALDLLDADSADAGGGPGEVAVDELLVQADGLEYLRAAVALECRDAHLGHDLDDALEDGLDVVFLGGLVVGTVGVRPLAGHLGEGLERDVRVDGARAVAEEEGYLAHVPRLAGLDDDADLRAKALTDEVVMQARSRQEAGYGGVLGVDVAVGQDDDGTSIGDGVGSGLAEGVHGAFEGAGAVSGPKDGRQGGRLGVSVLYGADLCKLCVGQNGSVELELAALIGSFVEQVALAADERLDGGDKLLAYRVEGRIADLSE